MTSLRTQFGAWITGLALLALPGAAHADLVFDVSVDTSLLIGRIDGSFAIDFVLINGSGTAPGVVTIDNFDFGGGMPTGSPSTLGGAGGDLSSSVTLRDTSFLNNFSQGFSPGTLLRFTVTSTTDVDAPIPDRFTFSILDGTGLPIATTDPTGADALLAFDLTGDRPTIETFGARGFNLGPPTVTIQAVPEPSSLVLFCIGLPCVLVYARRLPRELPRTGR